MRRYALLIVTLAVVGCGGSDGSSPTPPPPPPPAAPGPPASVSVQAGDNEEANPGAAVATAPTVMVRDAQNRGVPNVPVTFSVETGGGSLSASNATTDATGKATAGTWTLGPAEGPNTVRAAVGALAPVTFRATAKFQAAVLADTTIPATASEVTYRKTGHPLDGMTLTIPTGAFPGSSKWQFKTEASGTVTLPAGIKPAVPVITIQTDQVIADSLLFLKIPVRIGRDSIAVAFYYDEPTQRLEAIPLVAEDATSLTIATTHFNGDLMFTPARAAPARRMAAAADWGKPIKLIIVTDDSPLAGQPVTTGYVPGVDDWEFQNWGSYMAPGGICAGQSLSSIYAYLVQRSTFGSLFHHFDVLPNVWEDNPNGYRLATMVQNGSNWAETTLYLDKLKDYANRHGIDLDRLHYSAMVVGMRLNREPQMLGIRGPLGGHAIVAYGAVNDGISVADPNYPGQERRVIFSGGKFQPFQLSLKRGDPESAFDQIRMIGVSAFMNRMMLDGLWAKFTAQTIGQVEFPPYQLQWQDGDKNWHDVDASNKVITLESTIAFRTLCTFCDRQSRATGAVNLQQWTIVFDKDGAIVGTDTVSTDAAEFTLKPGISKVGVSIRGGRVNPAPAPDNVRWHWLDWRSVEVTSAQLELTPKTLTADMDKPYDFTVDDHGVATAGWTFVWSVDDGSAPVTQTTKVFSHTFTKMGEFTVKVELKNPDGKVAGRATTSVVLGTPKPYWRIETFELVSGGLVGDAKNVLDPVRQDPHKGLIYLNDLTDPSRSWIPWKAVVLQVAQGDVPQPGTGTRLNLVLAIDLPQHQSSYVDTGTLQAGTVSGSHCAYVGTSNTIASCARNSIDAVKNGAWLTGTIKFTPSKDGGDAREPTEYRFTARWP